MNPSSRSSFIFLIYVYISFSSSETEGEKSKSKKPKRKKVTNLGPVIKVTKITDQGGGVLVEALIETLESKTVTFEFHTLDFDPNEVSSAFVRIIILSFKTYKNVNNIYFNRLSSSFGKNNIGSSSTTNSWTWPSN